MNRAELRWALDAVIPHAKTFVALETSPARSQLYVWATDRASAGVAAVPLHIEVRCPWLCHLDVKEARELLRFIRPERVAEQQEAVELLLRLDADPIELHVGIAGDSAVFDCEVWESVTLASTLLPRLGTIWSMPVDQDCWTFNPDVFARFSRAKRLDCERLVMHPRRSQDGERLAVVTVGDNFIGAAAGMTDADESPRSLLLLKGE